MRPYRPADRVTQEQAEALVYAWWSVHFAKCLPETGTQYIVDWLFKGAMGFCKQLTISGVSDILVCHWGSDKKRLKDLWPRLPSAACDTPRGLLHMTTLKEFMNETPTRKDAAKKARRKNVVRRKAPRRVEKNKGA